MKTIGNTSSIEPISFENRLRTRPIHITKRKDTAYEPLLGKLEYRMDFNLYL